MSDFEFSLESGDIYFTGHFPLPLKSVGTMIFRDRGKRTENTESTIGNGKRIFKRKNTEMYF